MKVVSIFNIKGGVAKTTSTINIAASLSKMGKSVLIIDLDAQANSTKTMKSYDIEDNSITELLLNKNMEIHNCIKRTDFENIDILPSNIKLIIAEREILLDSTRSQQNRLKRALNKIEDKYDYCVIDCPPSLNMVTVNALVASDEVLVPIKIDQYALDGLGYLLDSIEEIKEEFNDKLIFKGCFVTMDSATTVNKIIKENLKSFLGDKFLNTTIKQNVKVIESTFNQEPVIFSYPKAKASQNYIDLVNEVFGNEVVGNE